MKIIYDNTPKYSTLDKKFTLLLINKEDTLIDAKLKALIISEITDITESLKDRVQQILDNDEYVRVIDTDRTHPIEILFSVKIECVDKV